MAIHHDQTAFFTSASQISRPSPVGFSVRKRCEEGRQHGFFKESRFALRLLDNMFIFKQTNF